MMQWDDRHRQFMSEHGDDELNSLLLQASRYPDVNMPWLVQQMEGRRKATVKFPTLLQFDSLIYPASVSVEQASSEATATYKASLVRGKEVIDLTGGFGIDSFFMSQQARRVVYVERNPLLYELSKHNFQCMHAPIETICDDGLTFLQTTHRHADYLYVDPSRRDHHQQRVIALDKYEPNVLTALPLFFQHAEHVLIKVSPMLDISSALRLLGYVAKVHVVSVKNECKELLFDCVPQPCESPEIVAVEAGTSKNQPVVFSMQEEQHASVTYVASPKRYLYEPNAALLKAGAFRLLSERFAVDKFHPASHLYTSNEPMLNFPGRIFEVTAVFPLNQQAINQWIPSHKVNITVRNFPLSVAEIRRRFKLEEGGDDYLFATTMSDQSKKLILCKKI